MRLPAHVHYSTAVGLERINRLPFFYGGIVFMYSTGTNCYVNTTTPSTHHFLSVSRIYATFLGWLRLHMFLGPSTYACLQQNAFAIAQRTASTFIVSKQRIFEDLLPAGEESCQNCSVICRVLARPQAPVERPAVKPPISTHEENHS